jgi:hypothetical protein
MNPAKNESQVTELHSSKQVNEIVDYQVTMLIAAGAAMAANCEPCLNKVVPDLIEAGVAETDIRKAVEIGQFVKDKPAAIMKAAADALTGTNMADPHQSQECPAEKMGHKATTEEISGCNMARG